MQINYVNIIPHAGSFFKLLFFLLSSVTLFVIVDLKCMHLYKWSYISKTSTFCAICKKLVYWRVNNCKIRLNTMLKINLKKADFTVKQTWVCFRTCWLVTWQYSIIIDFTIWYSIRHKQGRRYSWSAISSSTFLK